MPTSTTSGGIVTVGTPGPKPSSRPPRTSRIGYGIRSGPARRSSAAAETSSARSCSSSWAPNSAITGPSLGCQHLVEPAVARGGDRLPALADHRKVRPPLEFEEVGPGRRAPVLLDLRLRERRGDGVVLLQADDEQRSAAGPFEVHLRRRIPLEVREAGLVEDLARLRNRIPIVRRARV